MLLKDNAPKSDNEITLTEDNSCKEVMKTELVHKVAEYMAESSIHNLAEISVLVFAIAKVSGFSKNEFLSFCTTKGNYKKRRYKYE